MIIDITLILSMCLYFRNIICQRHAVVMLCWNIVEELTILKQVGLTLTLVLVFGVVFCSSLVRIFMLDPNSERKKDPQYFVPGPVVIHLSKFSTCPLMSR